MGRPRKDASEAEKAIFEECVYTKDGATKHVYREEVAEQLESEGWVKK